VIDEELLSALAAIRSDGNVLPPPTMTVQKRRIRGHDLAVVEVLPADAPPVRYKGQVWIRVGPRRAIATAEEERRLTEQRRSRDLPFDLRPIPSASIEDLDVELFRSTYLPAAVHPDVLAENQRSTIEQLRALRFVSPNGEPTVTGLLVLAPDPTQFLPGAYVQFIRFDGVTLSDPVKDEKTLRAPLLQLLREVEETLQLNVTVSVDLAAAAGAVERRVPDYPLVALQQLTRNAVMHRNYEGTHAPVRINWFSDRVEILSPGGPFGQVDIEHFGTPGLTDYRNPTLAEAMRVLGYVQRFGIGIQVARDALAKNGNPELELVVNERNVLAIVRRRP